MKASKTLARPENWQDFESLCKKLWGEIWQCQEIKKNGRAGQEQNGVDVYGIPIREDAYYGIQCKGKDEYTNKQLTIKEIDEEIEKALEFKPKLKKFYFATKALKDSKIESYIREKNLENRKLELFEVHLFSWEDIVDLIFENKATYDYYVKSINFKNNFSVTVTFQNNEKEIKVKPKFLREIIHYKQNTITEYPSSKHIFSDLIPKHEKSYAIPNIIGNSRAEINYSFFRLAFKIYNSGISPIEDYKLLIDIDKNISELADSNISTSGYGMLIRGGQLNRDTFVDKESKTVKVIPVDSILVGEDTFVTDEIFIKPVPKNYVLNITWKLISKDFKDQGELSINVEPTIKYKTKEVLVEDPLKVGSKEKDLEDYILIEE